MLVGLLCSLEAGLLWGVVFVAPLMLADYPGMVLSFGRYLAFGVIAVVLSATSNLLKRRSGAGAGGHRAAGRRRGTGRAYLPAPPVAFSVKSAP
ncbi:MAG: hypothetical protein ACOZB1_04705 [Pseudomonadota bacterium]|jgi:drug/metabolite transporter (DMT)-like permease